MAKGEVGAFVWPAGLGARKLLHRAHGVVAEVCRTGCIYLNRAQLMRRGIRQDVIYPAHSWLRRPRRQAPGGAQPSMESGFSLSTTPRCGCVPCLATCWLSRLFWRAWPKPSSATTRLWDGRPWWSDQVSLMGKFYNRCECQYFKAE